MFNKKVFAGLEIFKIRSAIDQRARNTMSSSTTSPWRGGKREIRASETITNRYRRAFSLSSVRQIQSGKHISIHFKVHLAPK